MGPGDEEGSVAVCERTKLASPQAQGFAPLFALLFVGRAPTASRRTRVFVARGPEFAETPARLEGAGGTFNAIAGMKPVESGG